jgi:Fungal Zn(2)-Cys(6) binuclear cluster domain
MPRPKVKPQDRRRSRKACDTCKSSKKRCDANLPCVLCVRKGVASSCSYSVTGRRNRVVQTQNVAVHQPSSEESSGLSTPVGLRRPLQNQEHRSSKSPAQLESGANSGGSGPSTILGASTSRSIGQRPVMLTSKSGDKGRRSSDICHDSLSFSIVAAMASRDKILVS